MIELSLLKALSIRDNFDKYRPLINDKTLSRQSLILLKDFEVYFQTFEGKNEVDFSSFSSFFFMTRHPFLDEKSILEFKEVLNSLVLLDFNQEIETILTSFNKQEFYQELTDLLEKNEEIDKIDSKIQEFKQTNQTSTQTSVRPHMDLSEALEYIDRGNGLQWRCEALRGHIGPLIKGMFGVIGAYTSGGKTSLLASELSYMAQQLVDNQYILWLNTEGDLKKILPRIYSAALNCDSTTLVNKKEAAQRRYKELMKGNEDRIVIVDSYDLNTKKVEKMLETDPPALVVFDLLDHISGFDKYINKEGGSVDRYKQLYQWALQMASKYCPVLATSQLNRDGFNKMYPDIINMEGSGVAKQSAAVFILMIGKLIGEQNIRYFSTPKIKEGDDSWKTEVKFDSLRSRFI